MYGFRPGRGCHDAIEQCFVRLRKGCDTWILDGDLQGAFDNLNHQFLLETIGLVPGRELIKQWLKAGYVESEMFHATDQGAPQGGSLSPLLLNISLSGLDELLSDISKGKIHPSVPTTMQFQKTQKSKAYGHCLYADDFLITAKSRNDIETIIPILKQWLAKRGLALNSKRPRSFTFNKDVTFLGSTSGTWEKNVSVRPKRKGVGIVKRYQRLAERQYLGQA